jgi:hypothetical chaperone protein
MEPIAGLDFGTTNSALAVLESGKSRSINISNYDTNERTLRSALFIDDEHEVFVGQEAIREYADAGGYHGRFMQSLKTFLPSQSFSETRAYGRRYTIESLVALILREVKRIGEETIEQPIDAVVLGRPVFFSEKEENDKLAQKRLEAAAKQAGFKSIIFELEPIAATLAYLEQLPSGTEQTILMGDFGGGTSDFTIMNLCAGAELTPEQKRDRVLAVDGVYIGGDTFDGRLMWEKVTPYFGRHLKYKSMTKQTLDMPSSITRTLCEWHKLPFMRTREMLQNLTEIRQTADHPELIDKLKHLIWENKGFALSQAIEKAKKELSSEGTATIRYHDRQVEINQAVTRVEFEMMIAKDVTEINNCVTRTLQTAGLNSDGIDKVLLTGGSSYIPAIRNVFESIFGKEKVVVLDAFTSVAQGLALSAR